MDQYHQFFATSTSAAGALIGLLFVSVTVQGNLDKNQQTKHLILAESSFGALANAFFISLTTLMSPSVITFAAVSITGALFGIASTIRVVAITHKDVRFQERNMRKQNGRVLGVILLIYLTQLYCAARLIGDKSNSTLARALVILIIVSFAVALVRAWEILSVKTK